MTSMIDHSDELGGDPAVSASNPSQSGRLAQLEVAASP
jgi:hypothetical protein